ncbi:MAG: siroheme synthase CysG [Gammaproteobacteria bacterium]|nr:siroheme synthase CysG [Gammaproteobacteria bacterium]
MSYFPIFADLEDRLCLVVGGGVVAHRKTLQLLSAGAAVRVNAPELCEPLQRLADEKKVEWLKGFYAAQSQTDTLLVIAATNDEMVNADVAADARAAQRLCNVVDDTERSAFIMPAMIRRDPVTIAISTAGAAPVLARWIKARIEAWLPARIGELARFAGRWRKTVGARLDTMQSRRIFWGSVFHGSVAEHVLAGRDRQANRLMTEQLDAAAVGQHHSVGEAWLVGAGPGDPELITLRGKQLLERADVVLYDRLVSPQLLEFARREAELIYVGKKNGDSHTQADIEKLLVQKVRDGKRVCRLKGGDSLVFARGGEELEALEAAGLPYQVVPGITAALACAAYAGIPLTHRDMSNSLTLGTGHAATSQSLAGIDKKQTLALYMSVGRLAEVSAELIREGFAVSTPCALVENGATCAQRVLRGRLDDIARAAAEHSIAAPAMFFVGETAALAGRHAWFEPDGFIDADTPPLPKLAAL